VEKPTERKAKNRPERLASSRVGPRSPAGTDPQTTRTNPARDRRGTGTKLRHEMIAEAAY